MLIEDLKRPFDLQLFAEDGATDTDTDDNIGGDTDDTGDVYGIDENGNLVITSGDVSHSAKHTDIDTEPEDTNDDEDLDEGEETSKAKQSPTTEEPRYKVKVDGEELEVPLNELLNGYMRQADYTRKTQALAQERKQFGQPTEQPGQQAQGVEQKQTPTAKEFYEGLTNVAKEAVRQDLSEDFDEFNPMHMAALAVKVNQFTAQLQAQTEKQTAIETFEAEARAKEPELYDAIYEFAQERVDYLPYRERVALEKAFAQGDVKVMNSFFNTMRKEYYNSKGMAVPGEEVKPTPKPIKKSAKPPVVEGVGNGDAPKVKTRNASDLGKMSHDAQANWLIEMGIV